MFEIELIDLKGDYVKLMFPGQWVKNRFGMWVGWMYAEKDWLLSYWQLPIPLFTEWWEAPHERSFSSSRV